MLRRSILTAVFLSLIQALPAMAGDPLPSWNDTPLKASLLDFVAKTTTEGSPDFLPPADRVAVFDNDGTLCTEQPMYFQFAFGVQRTKEQAANHPEWKTTQPFEAALEGDVVGLSKTEVPGLNLIVAGTHVGRTAEELQQSVNDWMATARHPSLHRPYGELVYQPMLELMQYLRAKGFKTYIVTGSTAQFLRPWAEKVYGVPPEQVIGSNIETVLTSTNGVTNVAVAEGVTYINNKANKALAIERATGRRPVLAFGNSDGDLDMLRYTAGSKVHWTGLVHHTDAEREFAYDRAALFGKLNAGLDDAVKNGWWVVDMKRDWGTVFPAGR